MKKRILLPLLCALMIQGTTAQAAEKLTVLLDWFVNPDHATLIIADDQDGNWQCGKHYFFCIKTQAIHRCTPWVARLSPNPVGVRTAGFRRKPAAGERNHLRLQLALNTSKELFT